MENCIWICACLLMRLVQVHEVRADGGEAEMERARCDLYRCVKRENADRLYKAWAEIEAARKRKGKQDEIPESR